MPQRFQSNRLRSGRFSESGRIYIVTSVTQNRRQVFTELLLGRLLVNEFRRAEYEEKCVSLAWVIMPDHFHWLLELKSDSLPQLIKQVKASSSVKINSATNTRGCLWQRGFHDKAVRSESDLLGVAHYIV